MRTFSPVCLAVAIAIGAVLAPSVTPPARADGFRNPPPDAAGMAAAGARFTRPGVAAAAYQPAGLLDLDQPAVQASASFVRLRNRFDPADGSPRQSARSSWQVLPHLHAGGPLRENAMAWGLGVGTPYGQAVEWDAEGPLRYTMPYRAQMTFLEAAPALAARLTSRLGLAIGFSAGVSELSFRQRIPGAALLGMPGPDGTLRFDGDGNGFGGQAGLVWDPAPSLRVAAGYRLPVRIRYRGDIRAEHPALPPGALDGDARTDVTFPDVATLGIGLRPRENLDLEASVEWLGWSRFDRQDFTFSGPLAALSPSSRTRWNDAWTVGAGAALRLGEAWTVRGGYRFLQSPIPDATYSPLLPDADRHVVGLGIGFRNGPHAIEAAWNVSFFRARRIEDSENPALNGTHRLDGDLAGLSYRFVF